MPLNVYHLVCPNGLGHFKRTTEIWSRLYDSMDVQVTVACEQWQWEKAQHTSAVRDLTRYSNFRFEYVDMAGALRWYDDPGIYSLENYQDFWKRLGKSKSLEQADIVLSDNLAGILQLAPDALLIGSFLWSDVLKNSFPDDQAPLEIVNHEEKLLKAHKPLCVSVEEVTMPSLHRWTTNEPVNWLCDEVYDRPLIKDRSTWNVLFSTGLSGASNEALGGLWNQFLEDDRFALWGTPAFKQQVNSDLEVPVQDFDFSPAAFRQIDLMVARPGVGTLTECVQYQIPIVAVDQGNNSEMRFNAQRVSEMGIGLDTLSQPELVPETLLKLYPEYSNNLKKQKVNGFDQIKKIINSYG